MIDKIQPNSPARYTSTTTAADNNKMGKAQTEARGTQEASAEVQLSDEAQALQRLMQAVKDAPDVRQDVVDKIRESIDSGEYEIDLQSLAQQLIPFMK
jgi:negative regulator of flagellin synthesis FlgM